MDIEAFILIGGRSSRFGRDKATMDFGGIPVVRRTADTIHDAISPPRITLVAANEMQLLAAAGLGLNLPFVFDVYAERGPVGGLHAAMSHARTE